MYDADGTVVGEVSYFLRSLVGRAHCDLCDITHGRIRQRDDWREVRDRMPVPFSTIHRDEQSDGVRAAADGALPVVVAALDDGTHVVLLGPEDLAACGGSPEQLLTRLRSAVEQRGLRW